MSFSDNNLYKFGGFQLDSREKLLSHADKRIPLTPKVFQMLVLFLENSGKLITKDELIEKIWNGEFVEESNITFTIRQLRKILDDDARQPKFIETIAKRGYRFVCEVEITQNEAPPKPEVLELLPDITNTNNQFKRYLVPIVVGIICLIGTIALASWYSLSTESNLISTLLSGSMVSQPITAPGTSGFGAISPDGKFAVYANIVNGKTSLWRMQIDTKEKVEILPPVADSYSILRISPNNEYVYFTRKENPTGNYDIFRVPVFGGVPIKLVSDTQGVFSLSSDEKQISFVRCPRETDDNCSLYLSNGDGKNERKLVTKARPIAITDNQISPDGKKIAFAAGQSSDNSKEYGLFEIDLENGEVKSILENQFFHIRDIKWISGGKELLLVGSRNAEDKPQIWLVDKNQQIVQVTKDSEFYTSISVNTDETKFVATQSRSNYNLFIGSLDEPEKLKKLAQARSGIDFTPAGKIIYSATFAIDNNIWEMDADGNNQRQLTNDKSINFMPLASPDGKFVFFASNRSGSNQVWRMNADGSNQIQLTQKVGGSPHAVSADGKWVYYRADLKANLWQVPIDGGEESLLFDDRKNRFAFSPDAKKVAFFELNNSVLMLRIYSIETKSVEKEYQLPTIDAQPESVVWSRNGNFLLYVAKLPAQNSYLYLQQINQNTPQKISDLGIEHTWQLAISPDNKHFAISRGNWDLNAVLISGTRKNKIDLIQTRKIAGKFIF